MWINIYRVPEQINVLLLFSNKNADYIKFACYRPNLDVTHIAEHAGLAYKELGHTKFVPMFMIYLYTHFHVPSIKDSLVIAIK